MYPVAEEIEEEIFMGKVVCSDCGLMLCFNGIVLSQYREYNGTPERQIDDTDNIMYMNCVKCFDRNIAFDMIESTGMPIPKELIDDIQRRHIPRTPNVPVDRPGFNWFGAEYKKERNAQLARYKSTTWLERLDAEWKDFDDEQWFSAIMEIPYKEDKSYLREILTIRCMIRLGWDYKQRLYRGNRYHYRMYGEGQVAEFHKNIKMGLCCLHCSGSFPQQYQIDPKINGLICGNCTNEKDLQMSINQHLGVL